MITGTDEWVKISSLVYYAGAGLVLIGTGIRYLVKFFLQQRDDAKLLRELQEVDVKAHLGNIYIALQVIAQELGIRINLNSPNLQLEDSWILSDSPQKKKSKE